MSSIESDEDSGNLFNIGPKLPSKRCDEATIMNGKKCQLKAYRHMKKKDGSISVHATEEPFKQLTTINAKDSAFALVINRFLDEKNNLEKSTIRINSFWILKVLREVVVSYPGVSSDFKTPFDLDSPYQMLLHSWDQLNERRCTTSDPDERMHLNFLFEFMDQEFGEQRESLLEMIRQGYTTFDTAWFLFRPGELLYSEYKGSPHVFRCKHTFYEANTTRGPYLDIIGSYTDHDGLRVGEATRVFTLYQKENFGGGQASIITGLPIYPLDHACKSDEFVDSIRKRGEQFLGLKDLTIAEYNGNMEYLKEANESIYDPEMGSWGAVWLPYTESGRLILDRKSFHEDMWYAHEIEVEEGKTDPLLCPPYTYAYSVAHKQWCRPFLDQLTCVQWKQDVWESLILPESERQVLRALVSSHNYPENARDQSKQKGKGLVILLHGSPGSGKTLTAETAAEGCQRALISASLGELEKSNGLYGFQKALRGLLRLATVWKAVVLLDEADVLLEVRDDNQTSRNAMVAVFLHELEYFGGIIFLTTNRVETFDKAMKSRIHLSLGYTPPTVEMRRQIWIHKLRAVPASEMGVDMTNLDDVLATNLNGREISNAVNTARTLARFEKTLLLTRHIQSVLDVHAKFLQNLNAAKATDADIEHAFEPKAIRRQNSIMTD